MDLPTHVTSSPRTSLASPGLTHRGKTPRTSSGLSQEHSQFDFNENNFQRQASIPEERTYPSEDKEYKPKPPTYTYNPSSPYQSPGRRRERPQYNACRSFIMGVSVTALFFGMLLVTGFFDWHGSGGSGGGGKGPKVRGLRGGDNLPNQIITSEGDRILQSTVDHHKSRVLIVPSLTPFSRRNVHHYAKHDPQGRLIEGGNERNISTSKRSFKVEQAHAYHVKRRAALPSAAEVMNAIPSESAGKGSLLLPPTFMTTGVAQFFHSITGVDEYHHFDVNDYFGSSVTKMHTDTKKGLTTLAVGAPGALENSGMIYFLTLDREGKVDSYSYLTNADDNLGDFWTANVALGWTVENIGDLDGDGFDDLAVGAIGYPHGSSNGAVYILFLNADSEIKSYKIITTGESGFTPTLKENSCFGSSIARLGDLDGDGVTEIAVGAMGVGKQRGGLYILYMNKDGTLKKTSQISSMYGWENKLNVEDQFGHAVRAIGDLDGDGVTEIAVGGDGFPSGEFYGSVWILYLTKEGTVKKWRRIDELDAILQAESLFGGSIDLVGDLDGDGLPEIVVGAPGANDFKGDAYIISLNADATVKTFKSLVDRVGVLASSIKEEDEFAWSLCNIGDINGDGIPDLAIGAETSPSDKNYGSLHIVFLAPQ